MQPLAGPHNDRIIAQTVSELQPQIQPQHVRLAGVWTVLGAILAVLVLMTSGGILALLTQNHRNSNLSSAVDSQSNQVRSQGAQIQQQQAALQSYVVIAGKLADQLRQNGIKPSVTPSATSPLSSAPTVTAPRLTNGQIEKALQSCWAAGQCDLKPTPAQLVVAFQTYCNIDGRCRGPAGRDATGTPGSPGASGTPGEPGLSPTPDQIGDAVTAYCSSRDNCRGYPSSIVIEVPTSVLDPNAVRTETCAPSSPTTDHIYTCK